MASSCVVPIVELKNVRPHPNADKLEIVDVLGYQMCVSKGRYKDGDIGVYFPADVLIPNEWAERFGVKDFLRGKNKDRVVKIKLRGEPSFGLVVDIPEGQCWKLGDNVAGFFGAEKYEPPIRPGVQNMAKYDENIDPFFYEYTDIENGKLFIDIFEGGEEVIATEKIHGCLVYRTRVLMADGSVKMISKIEKGESVLGVNEEGAIVPTKVLSTFKNGKTERWFNIRGKRKGAGKGNSFFSVFCTPNHKLWRKGDGWKEAKELTVGNSLCLVRYGYSLRPVQKQILLGKMLGDADLRVQNDVAFVRFRHVLKHKQYVEWSVKGLGNLAKMGRDDYVSGYGSKMCEGATSSSFLIKDFLESFYRNGKKIVPSWVFNKITPLAIAFWYMDDGFLNDNGKGAEVHAGFSTCAFSLSDLQILSESLQKFGVVCKQNKKKKLLTLNSDNAEKLFLLIAPYVPPIMQYKLPKRYRGHKGWLPKDEGEYKPWLVDEIVTNIEEVEKSQYRYDLETETHNFFANGILVHNSNSRVGIINGCPVAGSHTTRKQRPRMKVDTHGIDKEIPCEWDSEKVKHDIYWSPWSIENVRRMLLNLAEGGRNVVLFGEVYGRSIQSLSYGIEKGKGFGYRAFDLMMNGKYLDYDEFASLCTGFGVEMVPVIYRGPFYFEKIKEVADGQSIMPNANHCREGVVVKPVHERTDPKLGRVVLKYIGTEYSLGKHSDFKDV